MKSLKHIVSLALLVASLIGCSSNSSPVPLFHKGDPNAAQGGDGAPKPGEPGATTLPNNLALSSGLSAPADLDFDFKKLTEVSWLSAGEVVFSQESGRTISYNFKTSTWSSPLTSHEMADFLTLYDFRENGIVGYDDSILAFRLKGAPIEQIKANPAFKGIVPVGVSPGFLAFNSPTELNIFTIEAGQAQLLTFKDAPKNLVSIAPCTGVATCLALAYNGQNFFILTKEKTWLQHPILVTLPPEEKIRRVATELNASNAMVNLVAITESGKILYAYNGAVGQAIEVSWDQVKVLSTAYCIPCHKAEDDGFDKPETWTSMKTDLIARLSADPDSKIAMPKAKSQAAKDLSKADREKIIAWLNTQKETVKGNVGGGTGDPKDGPIAGVLKELADPKCIACHADAKETSWWVERKVDVEARIKDGSMPKGSVLDAATKAKWYEMLSKL